VFVPLAYSYSNNWGYVLFSFTPYAVLLKWENEIQMSEDKCCLLRTKILKKPEVKNKYAFEVIGFQS